MMVTDRRAAGPSAHDRFLLPDADTLDERLEVVR
jgi:hypothetical protein